MAGWVADELASGWETGWLDGGEAGWPAGLLRWWAGWMDGGRSGC